jgi:hypothetical protein
LRDEKPAFFEALEPVLAETGVLRTTPDSHSLEVFYGTVLQRALK